MRHWPWGPLAVTVGAIGLPDLPTRQERPAPPCPAAALAPLTVTRGTWAVRWLDRVTPGQYATSDARATIQTTAGACGLLEHFEGTRAGRRFEALTLIAPAGSDSLQRVWQDSDHGALLLFAADARAHPLRFEWSRDLGDRVLRLRTTYRVLTENGFTIETKLSPGGGQAWQLVSRQEYRRIGT